MTFYLKRVWNESNPDSVTFWTEMKLLKSNSGKNALKYLKSINLQDEAHFENKNSFRKYLSRFKRLSKKISLKYENIQKWLSQQYFLLSNTWKGKILPQTVLNIKMSLIHLILAFRVS